MTDEPKDFDITPIEAAENKEEAEPQLSDEEKELHKQRHLSVLQHQVAALMDELKKLFAPDMRLTFIARSVNDESRYSFLSEETDNGEVVALLNRIPKPKPIVRTEISNASN